MNEGGAQRELGKHAGTADGQDLRAAMAALAEQVKSARGGAACIVAWQSAAGNDLIAAPAGFPLELARAIFTTVEHEFRRCDARSASPIQLPSERLQSVAAGTLATGVIAVAMRDQEFRSTVILLTLQIGPRPDSLLSLAASAASAIASRAEIAVSRDFWRDRSSSLGEELAHSKSDLAEKLAWQAEQARAGAEARMLPASKRFAGLGAIFGRVAEADAWIVVTLADRDLRTEAVSTSLRKLPEVTHDGPVADCLREQRPVIRTHRGRDERYNEDRFFRGFPSYICLPFSHGAVALATNPAFSSKVVARLEQLARALDPIIERWLAEAEIARLQELVRTLGLRMFTAIDNERQCIARDLHDDQAQLLTAARLALETDPHQARAILKQLDEALRQRVRELRPATLGPAKLIDAIGMECNRLATAGISVKLLGSRAIAKIRRQGQELCYQIVREAFSNVLRHSAARRVTVRVACSEDKVLVTIEDDGAGPPDAADSSHAAPRGMGLTGMAERLQLMGGTLRLTRLNNRTRLTAEMPQF